jgi:nitrogen fixation/metabolism regulation signal transduction histidine kinase
VTKLGAGPRAWARLAVVALVSAAATVLAVRALADTDLARPARLALELGIGALVALVALRFLFVRPRRALAALDDGLLSLIEQDYSVRIARGAGDLGQLTERFNRLGERLRAERFETQQKDLMLEAVLGSAPMAVLLINEAERIVYANSAAADLLGGGPCEGRRLGDLLDRLPDAMRAGLAGDDGLFDLEQPDGKETYHLTRRHFSLSTQPHTLYMVKRMTREVERAEVEAWKKAIRLMSHELNNSLAPISSVIHSGRLILKNPEHTDKLGGVFDTIEDRTRHLRAFLEGYAQLARLPRPTPAAVPWATLLADVKGLMPFRFTGELPFAPGWFDATQLQQVLINLLKNAVESGSPPGEITVEVVVDPDGGATLRVLDRGKGMTPEQLDQAALPFYSTKKTGSGLGLALCREILDAHGGSLTLALRDGGGLVVECRLPAPPAR